MEKIFPKAVPMGLTSTEARALLKVYGKNEIVAKSQFTRVRQFLEILTDPMGLMMLGLSALYYLTGARTDAIIILIAYIPVTAVDVILKLRSEKALKALESKLQATAKVFRDGKLSDVPVQLLVPGDVLAFEEGQSLPADGDIMESHNLSINESALTGESLPVNKKEKAEFFAGTSVLIGRGLGRIRQTGLQTQFGKISHLLQDTKSEDSPLQKKVYSLVQKILFITIGLVILLFVIEYLRGAGLLRALITALTFGMAAVPEEFPIVFTLYLSLGALRLSKHGVLVKTLPSVESLGNVDVICTDKTGTLTLGKFSLVEIVPFGKLTDQERKSVALLACEPTPVDSMEQAIIEKIDGFESLKNTWSLTFDYPFEGLGKHMTHVWTNARGESILAMKGAAEGVLEHCQLDERERKKILEKVNHFASQGKRILGLATKRAVFSGVRTSDEKDVQFIGLLLFSDPVRQSAKKAIEECQAAGIEIKMLTGDHALTAHAIAEELNITHSDELIFSGTQLIEMSPERKAQAYLNGSIFARVTPEQKYELVKVLKDNGKVVAMTGDGVNDSPALKLADIGVSMGESATDVARSTAKMILLKNDFNGIVEAVFEGRNVFANLRRSFSYLIAFHIPVILLAFLPPILGWEQVLLPVHIILLEMIVHPISAFSFENLKSQISTDSKSLVPAVTAGTAVFSGVFLSLLSLWPIFFVDTNADFNYLRSLILSTILFGNIGLTLVESWPNWSSKRVLVVVFVLLVLPFGFCNTPWISRYFHLNEVQVFDLFQSFLIGMAASAPTFIFRRIYSDRKK